MMCLAVAYDNSSIWLPLHYGESVQVVFGINGARNFNDSLQQDSIQQYYKAYFLDFQVGREQIMVAGDQGLMFGYDNKQISKNDTRHPNSFRDEATARLKQEIRKARRNSKRAEVSRRQKADRAGDKGADVQLTHWRRTAGLKELDSSCHGQSL